MPMYIYECTSCQDTFKAMHSIEETLHDCETCLQKDTLKKVPSLLTSYSKQKTERDLAGERVAKNIEDNRKLLLDSKQEHLRKEYKP